MAVARHLEQDGDALRLGGATGTELAKEEEFPVNCLSVLRPHALASLVQAWHTLVPRDSFAEAGDPGVFHEFAVFVADVAAVANAEADGCDF